MRFVDGTTLKQSTSEDGWLIELPEICWSVDIQCVAPNLDEECKWLIDISLSLLRIGIRWDRHVPRIGMIESQPLRPTVIKNNAVKFKQTSVLIAGGSLPSWYEIDENVVSQTLTEKFITTAEAIQNPSKGSLAERFARGLGWMAKGRQSFDRSERFLFFFTALEALLSNSDKTSPIVQTISRHAAVITSDDNSARIEDSKTIKKLYEDRSALVHAGNRNVVWAAANTIQHATELVFSNVMDKCDLNMPHGDFNKSLSDASFGLPWGAQLDKLPNIDQ